MRICRVVDAGSGYCPALIKGGAMNIADNLIKMECFNCRGEFIVSEYAALKHDLTPVGVCYCPYCGERHTEWVSCTDDEIREEIHNKLGCLGISHEEPDPIVGIEILELTVRGFHALKRAGIDNVDELLYRWPDIKNVRNLGRRAYNDIGEKLVKAGYIEQFEPWE